MEGKLAIDALKKKLKVSTDSELATQLGVSLQSVRNWNNNSNIKPLQVARWVSSSQTAAKKETEKNALRPLVEFFELDQSKPSRRAKRELFTVADGHRTPHPYRTGLRDELGRNHGVYIFFDSRGHAIYAGKARSQSLWREMNAAYNRKRDSVQKIKRVKHPKNRVAYRSNEEKARQIVEHPVALHEIARYFSAYLVQDGMIDQLEALLVRSFANDLLNVRMERFIKKSSIA